MSSPTPLEAFNKPLTYSQDQLQALQLKRLKHTLEHAYQSVPFYKKSFDDQGIKPGDIKSLRDLSQLPFTGKEDLRQHYPFDFFALPMEQIVRLHASSGTTGKPTVVAYSAEDINTWTDLMARSLQVAGVSHKDRVHVAYGYGLFTGGIGAHYGAERLGACVIPMSGGQTPRQAQLLNDFQATVLLATPSYSLNILDELKRQNIDPQQLALRMGIFGAEPWTDAMRQELEQGFGIDAIDVYGLSEVIGPGVAIESIEAKDGPIIWEDHFYPEIIDPETGAVLPDGEEGELVFTSLTKQAMPVIRYRTRDLTRLLPPNHYSMRRMAKITGRSDDMLIIRGVNIFPSQIEECLLQDNRLSPHYLLVLERKNRLDELCVWVEPKTALSSMGAEAATQQLKDIIKGQVGISAQVVLKAPGTIARSEGKAQRVRDLRGLDQ